MGVLAIFTYLFLTQIFVHFFIYFFVQLFQNLASCCQTYPCFSFEIQNISYLHILCLFWNIWPTYVDPHIIHVSVILTYLYPTYYFVLVSVILTYLCLTYLFCACSSARNFHRIASPVKVTSRTRMKGENQRKTRKITKG